MCKLSGDKLCVDKLCVSKLWAGGGREAGGGRGGSTQPTTRTPRNDVGKKKTEGERRRSTNNKIKTRKMSNYFTSCDPHHDMYTFCYWQIF